MTSCHTSQPVTDGPTTTIRLRRFSNAASFPDVSPQLPGVLRGHQALF